MTETKLAKDKFLQVDGYEWYGQNRQNVNSNAKSPSGGVGILIKQKLLADYCVHIMDSQYEGILILKLMDKISEYNIVAGVCYLPPERSKFGWNAQGFFDHLLKVVYEVSDCDFIILGGDLNARIGTDQDFLQDIDEISPRQLLDLVKNSHGTDFINFLLEAKMCTINGRIPAKGQKQVTSNNVVSNTGDNYTSISSKGKAIVDYLFTAHSNIRQVNCCNVLTITDLCNKLTYQGDKLPDHSVIMCTVNLKQWDSNQIDQRVLQPENKATNSATDLNLCERIRYTMPKLSPHFTISEDCQNAINRTVTKLEHL